MLAFGGIEVQLPLGANWHWRLRNFRKCFCGRGWRRVDIFGMEVAVCSQVIGKAKDVDEKKIRAYNRALEDTTYGLSHLE